MIHQEFDEKISTIDFADICKKKKRKMKNEMDETLTSYLTRRSVLSSLFHFVIPALAPMSSLDEQIDLQI